jgi:hypothetical protein
MPPSTRVRRSLGCCVLAVLLWHPDDSEAQTASGTGTTYAQSSDRPPTTPETPVGPEASATPVSRLTEATAIPAVGGWKSLFATTLREFGQLPSRENAQILAFGALLAASVHPGDNEVSRSLSSAKELGPSVRPGAIVGSTPFQVASAIALYSVGRATDRPRLAHVGGDLIRAQLLAEGMVIGMKQAFRRDRPAGPGFSFPSGHTTVSFASATVLQRHFGWKVGLSAYGVAGYVALSRVQMRRHYLTDVAFGAALGIVAGRTISLGHDRGVQVSPMATPGGAGLSFTWIGKKTP